MLKSPENVEIKVENMDIAGNQYHVRASSKGKQIDIVRLTNTDENLRALAKDFIESGPHSQLIQTNNGDLIAVLRNTVSI